MKTISAILLMLLLTLSCITNTLAAPAVTDGLLVYYSFDDFDPLVDSTKVLDGSVNQYDGAVTGNLTSVTAGKMGKSVLFGNTGSPATCYVNLPVGDMSNIPTSAVTVSAWIKSLPGTQEVFSAQVAANMAVHMELRSDGGYRFVLRNSAGQTFFNTTFYIDDGANWSSGGVAIWQHFVVVYDRNTGDGKPIKVYLNGSLRAYGTQTTTTGTPPVEITDFDIGSVWLKAGLGTTINDLGRPFTGEMDEFYLFNKALSENDIKTLAGQLFTASAKITLGNVVAGFNPTSIPVQIDIADADDSSVPVRIVDTLLDSDSRFSIPYVEPGKNYTVVIKPSHWLRYKVGFPLHMPADNTYFGVVPNRDNTAPWTFINGDVNGSNKIDFTDYNLLMQQYKKPLVTTNCADLNGDGVVNFTDYNILMVNYKKTGD